MPPPPKEHSMTQQSQALKISCLLVAWCTGLLSREQCRRICSISFLGDKRETRKALSSWSQITKVAAPGRAEPPARSSTNDTGLTPGCRSRSWFCRPPDSCPPGLGPAGYVVKGKSKARWYAECGNSIWESLPSSVSGSGYFLHCFV